MVLTISSPRYCNATHLQNYPRSRSVERAAPVADRRPRYEGIADHGCARCASRAGAKSNAVDARQSWPTTVATLYQPAPKRQRPWLLFLRHLRRRLLTRYQHSTPGVDVRCATTAEPGAAAATTAAA